MSAIGRSRRSKNRAQQPRGDIPPELHVVPAPAPESTEHCDCAVCSGQVSPEQMLDELLAQGTELLRAEDPLDAEMLAAMLLAASPDPVEEFTAVVATDVVPALASVERTAALALLLAIGAVLPEPAGSAAATAARHLAAAGVPEPAWASELDEPVVAGDCWELTDPFGTGAVLACEFRRGSRSHGAVATVDNLNCGAADQLSLLDGGELAGALRELVEESAAEGLALEMTRVEPATSRWKLQAALDARAVHDQEDTGLDIDLEDIQGVEVIDNDVDDFFDEDGVPSYALLASLLRARITTLPKPTEAPPPHRAGNGAEALPPALQRIIGGLTGGAAGETLPAKRAKAEGPAPLYQLKVGLRGAKPPIWRRLEVPANISLAKLHEVIQAAFGWYDGHLHVFETPYGEFGAPDSELGHRSEKPVTLEQVAPAEGSKFRYVYDFGDDWDHEILVEKLHENQPGTIYPRCTGGKRAAPPEDCGGVWGYQELLATLADLAHPDHKAQLEWLGLDCPDQFNPAEFNKHEVTENLPHLR